MILLFRSCRRTRMARARSADVVVLGERRKQRLQAMVARPTTPQRLVLRAKIVLAAWCGRSTAAIARELEVTEDTVRKWRRRSPARAAGYLSLPDRADPVLAGPQTPSGPRLAQPPTGPAVHHHSASGLRAV